MEEKPPSQAPLDPSDKSQIPAMFGRIARRYDLLNRLMTLGRDRAWRAEALRRLAIPAAPCLLLDLGAGTGDLALTMQKKHPQARVVACDLTPEMVAIGRARTAGLPIHWLIADAQCLPFPPDTFAAATSGFLTRNLPDLDLVLDEQRRVLAPGGRISSLDTSPVETGWLRPLLHFHLNRVIPLLGRWIGRDPEAYTYLSNSTAAFLSAEALAARMEARGFGEVAFSRRSFGAIAVHWGRKPRAGG